MELCHQSLKSHFCRSVSQIPLHKYSRHTAQAFALRTDTVHHLSLQQSHQRKAFHCETMSSTLGFTSPSSVTSSLTSSPLRTSGLSGQNVTSRHPPSRQPTRPPSIQMKKSRFRQPLQPNRQEQKRSLPEDGTPVFAIFVRTARAKIWYPLGAVQGDGRSKGLVDAMKGGFMRSMYANALDKGIAQTVYGKDNARFLSNAVRMYPQLKKYQKDLEFGYRVSAVGLEEQPTKVVSKEMALPFTAWAKKQLDSVFKSDK